MSLSMQHGCLDRLTIMGEVSLSDMSLPYNGGILVGIDIGSRRVGVAVSDTRRAVASPLSVYGRKGGKRDALALKKILGDRVLGGLVFGLPVNMNNSEGPASRSARDYARNLAQELMVPYTMIDERLTTIAAEKTLLETGTARGRRQEIIDSVAACLILQTALDRMQFAKRYQ